MTLIELHPRLFEALCSWAHYHHGIFPKTDADIAAIIASRPLPLRWPIREEIRREILTEPNIGKALAAKIMAYLDSIIDWTEPLPNPERLWESAA